MNKEQIKFKKVIKRRIKRVGKEWAKELIKKAHIRARNG